MKDGSVDLSERKVGDWTESQAKPFLVGRGDFMITRGNGSRDLVGRGALVRTEPDGVAFPDTMIRARPDRRRILPEFLLLCWNSWSVRQQIVSVARTSAGIYKVNQAALSRIVLEVPSLHEQRRIVAILEEHLTSLDAAESALTSAGRRSASRMAKVLSQSRTGELVPLPGVAAIQGGIQKQQKRSPRHNAYPFLRVANVTSHGLDLAEVHLIELFGDELDRLRLREGDLLVVEGNGSPAQIGRAALWDGSIADCVHQNHLIRIRADRTQIVPEYLEVIWNSPENRRILTDVSSSSSGLHTLSVSKLERLLLPVPSVTEQLVIVETVERHRVAQRRLDVSLQVASARGRALRRSLLAAAFSGRLTGRASDSDVIETIADQEAS